MTSPAPPGYLSPAVRALARLHGFDPARVAGTGANGRVTVTDVLAGTVPASDCLLETQVDVTGDRRRDPDIAAAVRGAIQTVQTGRIAVSVGDSGTTRMVPALPGGVRAAIGVGAPFWTAAAVLTADGQRVLATRMHRVVVVRFVATGGHPDGATLLSAAAAAVGHTSRPTS